MPRILIIIPAFNEAKSIPEALTQLSGYFPDSTLLVINDGSTDETALVAKQHGAKVLNLRLNLGIGGAMQTGFIYAHLHDFDIAVQFDGDLQHPAAQISDLVQGLSTGGADIVIGSRFLEKKGYTTETIRFPGVLLLSSLVSRAIGSPITDTTSGFRAFNRRAISFFKESYPQYYPEPECLITAARSGLKVKEIPVVMAERKNGISSITFLKGLHYMFTVLLNIGMEMMRKRREIR